MKTNIKYRPLQADEIEALTGNGCLCNNWENVVVQDGFDPVFFINVTFSGKNKLGLITKVPSSEYGPGFVFGIVNALIHNCIIHDNVSIINIGNCIADYIIEDDVVIRNCGHIHIEGKTSFGNGTIVAVLNETGKRGVKIWDRLSAQQAYIMTMYRHRNDVLKAIDKMTDDYSDSLCSGTGIIGMGSSVINSQHIRNVKIGPFSRIDGILRLNDGSINSNESDPVFIGPGVIMEHFIICSGSTVTDSSLIDKCFIGQGCLLSKHFSAENTLFFANCVGYLGEASSVFAGPYTVTHHKSTLLLAGYFSFMNAGSGTNQSNHMYKLGPVHQGIMERGSKTTSDSYLLWPARVGAFTLVMGRHYKNSDTSALPFSYLIESNGDSILVPGINLKSVGTIRDAQKWPKRDIRKDPKKIDLINYNLLSPYTIKKMMLGRELLSTLENNRNFRSDRCPYDGLIIKRPSIKRGINLYQIGIDKFLGNSIIKRLGKEEISTQEDLRRKLTRDSAEGDGDWIDMAGLLVPQTETDRLLSHIENGEINSLEVINVAFEKMFKSYDKWEWNWTAGIIEQEEGKKTGELTSYDIISLIERWKKSVLELDTMLLEDSVKEFTPPSMTGFGIDGGDDIKKLDFEAVRGTFENNQVVASIKEHMVRKSALGDELIGRLQRINY